MMQQLVSSLSRTNEETEETEEQRAERLARQGKKQVKELKTDNTPAEQLPEDFWLPEDSVLLRSNAMFTADFGEDEDGEFYHSGEIQKIMLKCEKELPAARKEHMRVRNKFQDTIRTTRDTLYNFLMSKYKENGEKRHLFQVGETREGQPVFMFLDQKLRVKPTVEGMDACLAQVTPREILHQMRKAKSKMGWDAGIWACMNEKMKKDNEMANETLSLAIRSTNIPKKIDVEACPAGIMQQVTQKQAADSRKTIALQTQNLYIKLLNDVKHQCQQWLLNFMDKYNLSALEPFQQRNLATGTDTFGQYRRFKIMEQPPVLSTRILHDTLNRILDDKKKEFDKDMKKRAKKIKDKEEASILAEGFNEMDTEQLRHFFRDDYIQDLRTQLRDEIENREPISSIKLEHHKMSKKEYEAWLAEDEEEEEEEDPQPVQKKPASAKRSQRSARRSSKRQRV